MTAGRLRGLAGGYLLTTDATLTKRTHTQTKKTEQRVKDPKPNWKWTERFRTPKVLDEEEGRRGGEGGHERKR